MAKDKVPRWGTERRSMVMSESERRTAAWHESGHTLVGMFVGNDECTRSASFRAARPWA